MIYSVQEIYDFYELYNTSWSGAIQTLDLIIKYKLQEEFIWWLNYIIKEFYNGCIDRTTLNDFIWFEDQQICWEFFHNEMIEKNITKKQYKEILDYYGIEDI